ncbi:S8 family serine peptidase [Algisphaera agarilytica]|uniref:PEP-CTERM protein-sorting domain-containing protein n=1 Tax=Algisphaera agarilytica TaxID=1385975 RepID=A0A7X0H9I6_9BACT|nr:S8 family serine peptidase [Algisphaera agarilytica]MBB6430626.1 hypothetical protein [Algisphaera agarilytica]
MKSSTAVLAAGIALSCLGGQAQAAGPLEYSVDESYSIQARAQTSTSASGAVTYTVDENYTVQASSNFVTSVGGTFSGSAVNNLIGANRFYNAGYTGGGTIASNIEAGHVWGTGAGHTSLTHVTQYVDAGLGGQNGDFDRHATWVGQAIGGRPAGDNVASGIATGTDLRSGAIATSWTGSPYSLGFSINATSFYTPFASGVTGFGTADVINSSWGFTDPEGDSFFTVQIDGLANANPNSTMVFSAGNAGPTANTVGGAGSGYNSITVGALANDGSDNYDQMAAFSSRGPQDYDDPSQSVSPGVRAPVDIAAPGDTLTLAFYGGTTGGNTGGTASAGNSLYSPFVAGTSFAAPTTAGAIALMHDAANVATGSASGSALPSAAHDTRVIKATLLNAADKVRQNDGSAWDNGQADVAGVVTTTQSLDFESGAGGLNMDATFDQYLTGETDIVGISGGTSAFGHGWDFASVTGGAGNSTDIVLSSTFEAGTDFTATLTWFRDRSSIDAFNASDNAFADLDLQIWDSTFTTLLAESISDFNSVEHLHIELDVEGALGLRIVHDEMRFGVQNDVSFGLAWAGTLIPEPGTGMLIGLVATACFVRRRRVA